MIDHVYRIWGLAVKEFQQLSRDRLLLAFLILGPILELLLMGSMTGGGIENLPLAVVDNERTQASRELIAKLELTEELSVKAYVDDVEQARGWMQTGDIAAIAVIPPGYSAALTNPHESAQVQIIADGSSHFISTVALSAAEDVAAEIGDDMAAHQSTASKGPVDLRFVSRFNAALEDQPGSITAMLGLIVFQVTLIVAAQSFAREREMGTMEQLRVTPLRRLDLMVGKAIPTLLIGLVDFLVMIAIVVAWFDIPVRGSLLLLTLLTVPFVLAQIGWGTLISLVSRTQQQAMLFVFALVIVEVAFSGYLVPAGNMPGIMQTLSYASSLQHYLLILRSVLLRGTGIAQLWLPAAALVGISALVLGMAWMRLRAGLDTDSLQQRLIGAWHRARHWWRDERPSVRSKERRTSSTKPGWSGEPA